MIVEHNQRWQTKKNNALMMRIDRERERNRLKLEKKGMITEPKEEIQGDSECPRCGKELDGEARLCDRCVIEHGND